MHLSWSKSPLRGGCEGRWPARFLQGEDDLGKASGGIVANLKVPEPQNSPPSAAQLLVGQPVSLLGPRNLRVPVVARLTKGEVIGMAVPKGAVDEDCDFPASKSEVRPTRKRAGMTAPTTNAQREQPLANCQLRLRVLRANASHDPAAPRGREVIGHDKSVSTGSLISDATTRSLRTGHRAQRVA